jgi:ABC-2 type transport system permease protein
VTSGAAARQASTAPTRAGVVRATRVELRKLASQAVVKGALVVSSLGPFVFALILRIQPAVPADTLFGVWAKSSGFAVALVALSFIAAWGLPLLTALVAGDIFASEDRYDTWKTVLTRAASRNELFAGKAIAASIYSLAVLVVVALSSIVSGVLVIGTGRLVSLDGEALPAGHAALLVVAAWASLVPPVLMFTCIALLFSLLAPSGIAAILGAALTGLVLQLLALVGGGEIVRTLLPSTPFEAWHQFFTHPAHTSPLAQGVIVSTAYTSLLVWVAWTVFRRRGFAARLETRSRSWRTTLARFAIAAAAITLLATASSWGPNRLTAAKLENAIAPTFTNLVLYQQRLLGRFVPAGASLTVLPACRRRGVNHPQRGAGDNWFCTLNLVGHSLQQKPINYEVTLHPNGCYTADGIPSIIGPATMHDNRGRPVVNPLYRFYGCINTLASWP